MEKNPFVWGFCKRARFARGSFAFRESTNYFFVHKKSPICVGPLYEKEPHLCGVLSYFGNLLILSFLVLLHKKEPYLCGALVCKRASIVWGSFAFKKPIFI